MLNMKQFLLSIFKKIFFRNSGPDVILKIEELEKQVKEIKLRINDTQWLKIDKIIVEKIICEKVETSYKIDSITNENLSGTMNIGTIYPVSAQETLQKKVEEPSIPPETETPKLNIIYSQNK